MDTSSSFYSFSAHDPLLVVQYCVSIKSIPEALSLHYSYKKFSIRYEKLKIGLIFLSIHLISDCKRLSSVIFIPLKTLVIKNIGCFLS